VGWLVRGGFDQHNVGRAARRRVGTARWLTARGRLRLRCSLLRRCGQHAVAALPAKCLPLKAMLPPALSTARLACLLASLPARATDQ